MPNREAAVRVAIIGCGRIGTRRAEVLLDAGDEVAVVMDTERARAEELGARLGVPHTHDLEDVLGRSNVDAVVVATVNSALAETTNTAVCAGKHVLCEKPFATSAAQARWVASSAKGSAAVIKVGFNHRYHRAISRAHEIVDEGRIGRVLAVRAAYGHGGRLGYENEWRADPALAGGGELMDQGVHLIDLSRWFLGELHVVTGVTATWFWPIQPLEDNVFALLVTADGRIASLHASWTQWRNLFRFEVMGEKGFVVAEGLGGHYGPETLTVGSRTQIGSPPEETTWTFDGPDPSWRLEWSDFTSAIRTGRKPLGSLADGVAAAVIVEEIYRAASRRVTAPVPLRVAE